MRCVAVALVSSGEVAKIALEECNRRAADLGPQNRAVRLARIEQAPAPPSAERQGPGPVAHHVDVVSDAAGCASGEQEVRGYPWVKTRFRSRAGIRPATSWLLVVRKQQRKGGERQIDMWLL